jgi:hypothetical protein
MEIGGTDGKAGSTTVKAALCCPGEQYDLV